MEAFLFLEFFRSFCLKTKMDIVISLLLSSFARASFVSIANNSFREIEIIFYVSLCGLIMNPYCELANNKIRFNLFNLRNPCSPLRACKQYPLRLSGFARAFFCEHREQFLLCFLMYLMWFNYECLL